MRIIPAIDIIEGKCVRLVQGDFSQKTIYHDSPLELARQFEKMGFRYLHLVDLDGAKAKKVINLKILEQITEQTSLQVDFGGGVQSDEDIEKVFQAGAKQITAGSIAIQNPKLVEKWLDKYGPERIILGADVREEFIAISGWQETTTQTITDFLQFYQKKGIQYVICTDVSKDGLLQGTSLRLYEKITQLFPSLKIIASGGISSLQDLLALKKLNINGAIIGKAFYEGKIFIDDLQIFFN